MTEPADDPVTSYAICALPRSGSWLLTLGLEDTGLAGRPRPYLCGLSARDQLPGRTRLDSLRAAIAELRRHNASAAGVFGIKLESSDLDEVLAWVRADGSFAGSGTELLAALLPGLRYLYLVRHDKTRQAISLLRGLHSLRWMQTARTDAADGWVPDMTVLHSIRELLIDHEERWEAFFSAAGMQPYRISYEQLGDGPAGYRAAISGVLGYLDVPVRPDMTLALPRLSRQADQRTDEWAEGYEAWRLSCSRRESTGHKALDQVAALPRQAHQLLGDGRLTLDDAVRIVMTAGGSPAQERVLAEVAAGRTVEEALRATPATGTPERLGGRLLRALSDDDRAAPAELEERQP